MSLIYPCVYCTDDLHCTKYAEPGYECWCVLGPCTAETPSNGDMIRRMSDEELAIFLKWVDFGRNYPGDKTWLDWLKSPVEIDDGT